MKGRLNQKNAPARKPSGDFPNRYLKNPRHPFSEVRQNESKDDKRSGHVANQT